MLWVTPGRGEPWALSCTTEVRFMKGSITSLPRMKSSIKIPRMDLVISGQNLFTRAASPLKFQWWMFCYHHFRIQSMSLCQTLHILNLNSLDLLPNKSQYKFGKCMEPAEVFRILYYTKKKLQLISVRWWRWKKIGEFLFACLMPSGKLCFVSRAGPHGGWFGAHGRSWRHSIVLRDTEQAFSF